MKSPGMSMKNAQINNNVNRVVFAVAVVAVVTTNASAAALQRDASHLQHRVLTDAEGGTVYFAPLLPHRAHLERRRRELRDKYGAALDAAAAPPRPHTSRHSHAKEHGHDRALQQQVSDQTQHTGASLYQGYGTHYVDLWVGSPPQRQTVIVDTGSGVTAFPCSGCHGCGESYHTDGYFDEAESATFHPLACGECAQGQCSGEGCHIGMSYAEGSSWGAYEGQDVCYAGGPHDELAHQDPVDASRFKFEFVFGCQTSLTGLFKTQLADGIMGMENGKSAFWKQMYSKSAISRPEFALCFSRSEGDGDRGGTEAGAMTLGGVEPRLHTTPMVFAQNKKNAGFYAVHLKAAFLREESVSEGEMGRMISLGLSESELNSGNVIVDSGTTDTYFTRKLAGPFKKAWKQLIGSDYDHRAVSLSAEELATLPTIVFFLSGYDGDAVGDEPAGNPASVAGYVGENAGEWANPRDVVLAIPAAHYMEYDPKTSKYTARFYVEEASGSVFGANAMMGHDVYFDTARGRIGFAESECDYAALLAVDEMDGAEPGPHTASEKVAVDEKMEGDQ